MMVFDQDENTDEGRALARSEDKYSLQEGVLEAYSSPCI
jgi:hypothetical protein